MYKSIFLLLSMMLYASAHSQTKDRNLIIGTYTNSCESKGIYVYDFNLETADFRLKNHTEGVINPSFLALSPDNQFLYSVNENGKESTVSSFWFTPGPGNLEFLGKQDSKGADPCYIISDQANVIVANYSGGTISVFGRNKFGALKEAKQVIAHSGKGTNAQRQEGPHVHMVYFSPDRKYVLANDLGSDHVYIYSYHPEAESQALQFKGKIAVKPGSGPRHLTFSGDGKSVYLLHELDGSLSVFNYADGNLKQTAETTVVPKDFKGETSAADIHISPDSRFLYATNRGDANTISCFEIQEGGNLKLIEHLATGGKGPRNFAIDPSGNYLLVAHQYTNNVVIFKIDKGSGKLTDTGKRIELCAPVCLVFGQ